MAPNRYEFAINPSIPCRTSDFDSSVLSRQKELDNDPILYDYLLLKICPSAWRKHCFRMNWSLVSHVENQQNPVPMETLTIPLAPIVHMVLAATQ